MKIVAFFLILIVQSNFVWSQNKWFEVFTDSTLIIKQGDELIQDFQKKITEIDKNIDLKNPKTVYHFMGPFYSYDKNTVNLPIWKNSPQWYKDFCIDVAGGAEEGKKMFGLFFNGFYVPHELGHALQFKYDIQEDNLYDNEYVANIIGLLYWKQKGKEKELEECYEFAKKALWKMKNPIPENEDVKKYFTENYSGFLQDPYKYGYIQFEQFIKVYEDNSLPDFDTFLKSIISKK